MLVPSYINAISSGVAKITVIQRCLDAALHRPTSHQFVRAIRNWASRTTKWNNSVGFVANSLLLDPLPNDNGITNADTLENGLFTEPLNQALWHDHSVGMLPYLLHFGDAMSMAHSVESRLPFLDHRLVEFVFALPGKYKLQGSRSKVIMRQALQQSIPKEILARRKKIGFFTPVDKWVRQHLQSEIKPRLLSSHVRQRGVFNFSKLEQLIAQCEQFGTGSTWIYRCPAIELWFQTFIDA